MRFRGFTDFLYGIETDTSVTRRCQELARAYYVDGLSLIELEALFDIGINSRGTSSRIILRKINEMARDGLIPPTWVSEARAAAIIGGGRLHARICKRTEDFDKYGLLPKKGG